MKEIYGVELTPIVWSELEDYDIYYYVDVKDQHGNVWCGKVYKTKPTETQIKTVLNKAVKLVRESVREYLAG